MAYFCVSYQLNKSKNYPKLWEEMGRLDGHKAMRSFYLLDLNNTAEEVKDHLVQFVDDDDMIFVAEMTKRPAPHRCYKGTTAWLDKRF